MWISPWALLIALVAFVFVLGIWSAIAVAVCRSRRAQHLEAMESAEDWTGH